jgi:hypothetical protein
MKSPHGNINRMNVEWSSKGRKEEDRLRGLAHTARREAIEEGFADFEPLDDIVLIEPDVEFDDGPWFDQGDGFADWQADCLDWLDQQFFDDPA